jgi:hypothetical protein
MRGRSLSHSFASIWRARRVVPGRYRTIFREPMFKEVLGLMRERIKQTEHRATIRRWHPAVRQSGRLSDQAGDELGLFSKGVDQAARLATCFRLRHSVRIWPLCHMNKHMLRGAPNPKRQWIRDVAFNPVCSGKGRFEWLEPPKAATGIL